MSQENIQRCKFNHKQLLGQFTTMVLFFYHFLIGSKLHRKNVTICLVNMDQNLRGRYISISSKSITKALNIHFVENTRKLWFQSIICIQILFPNLQCVVVFTCYLCDVGGSCIDQKIWVLIRVDKHDKNIAETVEYLVIEIVSNSNLL